MFDWIGVRLTACDDFKAIVRSMPSQGPEFDSAMVRIARDKIASVTGAAREFWLAVLIRFAKLGAP